MENQTTRFEKKFVAIKGENSRYEELDKTLYQQNCLQNDSDLSKKVWSEINFFAVLAGGKDLFGEYRHYYEDIKDITFAGKVIIRPYKSLWEAVADGIHGCFDVGLLAEGISSADGYLFTVKVPKAEDKAFAYVLYDHEGNIKQARQAFNLDVVNPTVLKYLELFSKNVLKPALENNVKVAIA